MTLKAVVLDSGILNQQTPCIPIAHNPLSRSEKAPMLFHILLQFAHYGVTDFVIAEGNQGRALRRFIEQLPSGIEGIPSYVRRAKHWHIDWVDMTDITFSGGQLQLMRPMLDETFYLVMGDAVSDVNLEDLLDFHHSHDKIATLTVVRPKADFDNASTLNQPRWLNAGYYVLEPDALLTIEDAWTEWEHAPLEQLNRSGQVMAYQHVGFWKNLRTLRDKRILNRLWKSGKAPWETQEHRALRVDASQQGQSAS